MTTKTLTTRKPINWRRIGAWALVVLALIVTILPFLWMLRTAVSSNESLASNSANLLPADFSWGAFKRVFGMQSTEEAIAEGGSGAAINFWLYLRNSILFATVTTAARSCSVHLPPTPLPGSAGPDGTRSSPCSWPP